MRTWRTALAVVVVAVAGTTASPASAAISGVLGGHTVSGSAIPCTTQADGTRVCQGDFSSSGGPDTRLASFDGTPLALYVILPPAPASGNDGNYPLVVQSHGWGGQAGGPSDTQYGGPTADAWAKDGYAVLQLTARGFGDSCGSAASRLADPTGCADGYIRLDDDRYEVRDVQNAIGLLVDDGIADAARIGVTGESYGGGVSLALATLRDRVMNADGSVSPWRSPAGTPLRIAAAAPVIPWSDLVYSLIPNGRTLDYQVASPTTDLSPIGVEKQSFVSGLYALGSLSGFYAPAGLNSQADLTTWFASLNAGEPYDGNAEDEAIAAQIAQYHSSYYLLDGAYGVTPEAPPPLLIANGFTDDLFPVDEALRYYNLERAKYPSDWISLFDFDGGHQRGQNKAADSTLLSDQIEEFLKFFLKVPAGNPRAFPASATALTQTCPKTATSGGPFTAPTWAALHPGEVDFDSAAAQTVTSGAGSPTVAQAVDPDHRARGLRHRDRYRSGLRRRHLSAAGGHRVRLHRARLPGRDRDPEPQRDVPRARGPPVGRGPREQHRDARGPRPVPRHRKRRAGLPAASRRLALRRRPHPQARAARPGQPLRAHLQRPVLDRCLRPGAAPARARGPGRARHARGSDLAAAALLVVGGPLHRPADVADRQARGPGQPTRLLRARPCLRAAVPGGPRLRAPPGAGRPRVRQRLPPIGPRPLPVPAPQRAAHRQALVRQAGPVPRHRRGGVVAAPPPAHPPRDLSHPRRRGRRAPHPPAPQRRVGGARAREVACPGVSPDPPASPDPSESPGAVTSPVVVAREWTRLGLIGFGGPPAHIALLRQLVVERRRWMDARAFEDANAACGMLPGPASTQMAIYCAYRVAGPAGAVIGGLGFIVPAVVIILAVSAVVLGHAPPLWVRGAGAGAGAAVPAVAVQAARGLLGPSLERARSRSDLWAWAAYVVAGAAAAVLVGAYLVLVLVACGALEVARRRRAQSLPAIPLPALPAVASAGGYGALAWTALKVGALSFGGGFVIIPLMQGDAVHVHHWMTNAEFLNAVALGQVTPGPVVATIAAVGYAAHGLAGGIMAASIAFLPSFGFVLLAGRRFDGLRERPGPRAFLDGAGPAAIGAIGGAAVTLAAVLTQAWQFGVLAAALLALLVFGRGVVLTLVSAALVGVVLALAGAPIP